MNISVNRDERLALMQCVQEAAEIEGVDRQLCDELRRRLYEEIFHLVVVGQFKRGKSTVINALLGKAILPMGVIPLTSVVTVIRYGDTPAATVDFESGATRPVEVTALAEYATESGNPGNVKRVREVQVEYPSEWLRGGVRLVDTPGIGSVYEHNTDMTMRFIPRADAVLFVGALDQPMGRDEVAFLERVRPFAAKLFCLMNKIDHLEAAELQEALEFSRAVISRAVGTTVPIHAIGARATLKEGTSTAMSPVGTHGFREFETALREFLHTDKAAVGLRSTANGLRRALAQARLNLELESRALRAPLELINARLENFGDKKAWALRAKLDYDVLLQADIKRLFQEELQEKLRLFQQSQAKRIPGLIDEWARDAGSLSARRLMATLQERLYAEIRAAYDNWIAAEEPALFGGGKQIFDRFSAGIQKTIGELMTHSAELFGVEFTALAVWPEWRPDSEFRYKFWHEPAALETIAFSIVLAMPRTLARHLIVTKMRRRACELIELHAGRLRYDLEERLYASGARFRQQMRETLNATIVAIARAIQSGLERRAHGTQSVAERDARLRGELERIAEVDDRCVANMK